jgi:hypothetical protein
MITTKTCLILGAGASAPYGMPTAVALRRLMLASEVPRAGEVAVNYPTLGPDERVRDHREDPRVSNEKKFSRARTDWINFLNKICQDAGFDQGIVKGFRTTFFRARQTSIDKFIQRYEKEYGDVGRLHMAAAVLNCEQDRWLNEDWYAQLIDEIAPKGPDDIKDDMLSIITFNYDRSFEQFFRDAFQYGFRMSAKAAGALFSRIRIVHVYGNLGSLNDTPYGKISVAKEAASRISFIRDAEAAPCRREINDALQDATSVCFIGFGFAAENLALFEPETFKGKRVIATSIGLSPNRKSEIQKKIKAVRFFDGTASELLNSENLFEARKAKPPTQIPVRRRSNFVRSAMRTEPWMGF